MNKKISILLALSIAAMSLMASGAFADTTSLNYGSLGSAGNGTNVTAVTLTQQGPTSTVGDIAAGYSGAAGVHTTVPYNPALNPSSSSPFTIEFWVNPAAATDDNIGPCPMFNRVTTGNRSGWVFFQRSPTTGWDFKMYNGNGSAVGLDLVGGSAPVNTWLNIAVTWDGTTASLYQNGVFQASNTGTYVSSTSAIFSVGSYDTGTNPYNGLVDDVAFYGSALSGSQLLAHYNAAATSLEAHAAAILADNPIVYLPNQPVPEPSTLVLAGLGAILGAIFLRRRK
jgi:hypothetical protein